MCGGIVEIELLLFNVFAMVALARRHSIGTLFENRILSVPEGKTENDELVAVTDCG